MKNRNNTLPIICFMVAIVVSCEKVDPPDALPPLSKEGKNTFGCMIDDQVFVPYIEGFQGPDGLPGEIDFGSFPRYPKYFFSVGAFKALDGGNKTENVSLYLKANISNTIGSYTFSEIALEYKSITYENIVWSDLDILRYDSINKIISGTFNAGLYNNHDTINLTKGRFDLKIDKY